MHGTPTGPLEQEAKPLTGALPRRKSVEPADYLWELRRIGAKAALIVQVTVDRSGRVAEIRRDRVRCCSRRLDRAVDVAAERMAADAGRGSVAALSAWRFDEPASPITFQLSFGFVAGQARPLVGRPLQTRCCLRGVRRRRGRREGAMPTSKALQPPKKTVHEARVSEGALDARVQGEVLLEIVIATDGRLADAEYSSRYAARSGRHRGDAGSTLRTGGDQRPPVRVISMVTHTFSFETKTE